MLGGVGRAGGQMIHVGTTNFGASLTAARFVTSAHVPFAYFPAHKQQPEIMLVGKRQGKS